VPGYYPWRGVLCQAYAFTPNAPFEVRWTWELSPTQSPSGAAPDRAPGRLGGPLCHYATVPLSHRVPLCFRETILESLLILRLCSGQGLRLRLRLRPVGLSRSVHSQYMNRETNPRNSCNSWLLDGDSARREHLARVEDAQRIQGLLELALDVDGDRAQVLLHIIPLESPDAVLAR